MNKVILRGNLVRKPEVKEIETGDRTTTVANFSIAVSRFFRKANGERDKDTVFIPCEAWDTGAVSIGNLLDKGDPVLIEGSLKSDSWEKDGQKLSRLKVRVSNFEKLYRAPPRDESEQQTEAEASKDSVELVGAESSEPGNIPF
tara:strand:+ start:7334 stop:7765 length:432 start_codon:yes stop_codon:yes gene_type:complete